MARFLSPSKQNRHRPLYAGDPFLLPKKMDRPDKPGDDEWGVGGSGES
jgi:hypothetical protein